MLCVISKTNRQCVWQSQCQVRGAANGQSFLRYCCGTYQRKKKVKIKVASKQQNDVSNMASGNEKPAQVMRLTRNITPVHYNDEIKKTAVIGQGHPEESVNH